MKRMAESDQGEPDLPNDAGGVSFKEQEVDG